MGLATQRTAAAHVVGSSEETLEDGVVPTLENEPIVPNGWGIDEEDLPPSDVNAEEEEMSTEFYFISHEEYEAGRNNEYKGVEGDQPRYDEDLEEGEISIKLCSFCCEAL